MPPVRNWARVGAGLGTYELDGKAWKRVLVRHERVFTSIIRLVWENRPLRDARPPRYPGTGTIHRLLTQCADRGELQRAWGRYLDGLTAAQRRSWRDRFDQILHGRLKRPGDPRRNAY